MLYKNDIANLAIGHLGSSLSVLDFENEQTNQARIIRRYYRSALDKVLEKYPWRFATAYAALPLVEENPAPGFRFCYALPADLAVLRQIAMDGQFPKHVQYDDMKANWEEVYNGTGGTLIYTDIPRAHGKYTVRVPTDNALPTHVGEAVAFQLAIDIGPSLITNNFPKIQQSLMTTVRNGISDCYSIDLNRAPQQKDAPNPFIAARHV